MFTLKATLCQFLKTRHFLLVFFFYMSVFMSATGKPKSDINKGITDSTIFQKISKTRYKYPSSSLALLNKAYEDFIEKGDTLNAIKALTKYANINGHLANYKDAYDKLWEGLFLANEANLEIEKANLYIEIGRFYSFYKKRDKALEYFQISLDINQRLLAEEKIKKSDIIENYYAFVATYRELDDFQMAKKYIDSCYQFFDPAARTYEEYFLVFESACISSAEGKFAEALLKFENVEKWFEEYEATYLVLFYTYKSDALLGLNRLDESEIFYKKALEVSAQYNMHIDFTPIIHEKLSKLYLKEGNYQKAFESLRNVKDLDAAFFDSRSEKNQSLLEIQDAFRMEQKAQEELLKEQKLETLEQEQNVWVLQRVIGVVSILFLISISYLYLRYVRANYRAEKEILRKEKALELQKTNEILEIKNKELAASALKLIEKDENLMSLKNKIKAADGNLKPSDLKKIVKSISISYDHNWKEFETRFIAVNENFYTNARKKFPKLTQKDLKLCALIKLNFSSKEMAKLLGISIESAHTSRHRLRKKLNLTRDINLTEFIASI